MLVTNIDLQKKDPNRFNLFLDDKFAAGISADTVVKFSLYKGVEVSDEELDQILRFEYEKSFYNRVISYISRGIKPERKIRTYIRGVLHKKRDQWFPDFDAEKFEEMENQLIDRLKADGYINDYEYAEAYVESRMKLKPRSISLLRQELLQKGVNSDVVEELFSVKSESIDELQLIKNVYMKKFGESKLEKTDQKKIAFLQRKGFSWDLISKMIKGE